MVRGKGWFFESRRHRLSALGIKTGRKLLPKKPLSVIGGDQKLFYPKKDGMVKVFGHQYIYNPETEKMARLFFIKRFKRDPTHFAEKGYFEEWRHRFYTGEPTLYMDKMSKKVYLDIQKGDTAFPKDWKGKGGINVKLVKLKYTKNNTGKILTIGDVKRLNEGAGGYWFSPDTLKFFKSRFTETDKLIKGKYFITSEQNPEGSRMFSVRAFDPKTKDISTVGEFHSFATKKEAMEYATTLNYTKNNKAGKIVKGALIGATVGALTYKGKGRKIYFAFNKEGLKGVTIGAISQKQALKFAKDIHGKGAKVELWKLPRGKKMKGKKLNYNEDVTYEQPVVSGVEIPEKVGFLKKVGRGAVAVGRGAKATFEKGQEITAKLRKIQEEREAKEMLRTQKELLKAQSQLQVVRAREKLKATKKEIEAGRESILPKIF